MPLRRVDSSMFPTDTAAARNALQIVSDFSVQLQLADLLGDRMGFINSFADPFDDESDVATGSKINAVYNAASDFYSPLTTGGAAISQAVGTQITNFTGAPSVMFDGTTNTVDASTSYRAGPNVYAGKNYSSSPKAISKATVHGSNNSGYINAAAPSLTITLYGKTGAVPSSGTDGTVLGSITFTDLANESTGRDITSSDQTTLWDHVWVYFDSPSGSNNIMLAELVFSEALVRNNMTLVSNAYTALVTPKTGRLVIQGIPNEAIVLNTDLKGWISRDNGTTWSQVTLALTIDGTAKIYEGSVSLVGQPTGTQMRWKVTTHNGKNIDVSGVVIGWTT